MDVPFDEWTKDVPMEIRRDSLWRVQAYQLALYLFDLCHQDSEYCRKDDQARVLWDQLYRATGSISANIAEGYSKSTGKDRARFYEYALGSAREARDWYYKSKRGLPSEIVATRIALLTEIIKMLSSLIPRQRQRSIREEPDNYTT